MQLVSVYVMSLKLLVTLIQSHTQKCLILQLIVETVIMKACPCNIQRFFFRKKKKNENFIGFFFFFFSLQKLAHVIYRFFSWEIFQWKIFDIFLIFAQNRDCWCMLGKAILTSTHNLCFGAKIRKVGIPLLTPVLLYKSGV